MFAAAAIVAKWVWEAALEVARWLAFKIFIVAVLVTVAPWVLKKVFIWTWDYGQGFILEMIGYVMSTINSYLVSAGIDVNINLTGVGGYLAIQTGLIDYAQIIFAAWGIYWTISLLSKVMGMIRL